MDTDLENQQQGAESSASGTTLSAQQLYQHDPLLVLLKDTWRLNDFWVIAGVIVPPGAVYVLWWFWGEYVAKVHFWLLGDTVGALLQTLVNWPLLFLIYLLLPASIAGLFNTLSANGVIGERRKDRPGSPSYEDFLQQLVAWTDSRWWTATALMVVVLYLFYRLVLIDPHIPSPVPFWQLAVANIVFSPLLYITFMSITRLLLALVFTNWLFYTFTILIKPLHPDGSGGLNALGHLLWFSVLTMFWDALFLSTVIISIAKSLVSPIEMVLLAAIYVALTPSLLIGWLLLPHRLMVSAREEALQPLAEEFQQALIQSMSSTERDTRAVVAGARRLAALKQQYELVCDTFPTWPVEISALRRLVVTVIFPFLSLLASLIPPVSHALGLPQ
jgi:hypothetical protein